jgi:ABC-type molybdate transport system substrate-binding protein
MNFAAEINVAVASNFSTPMKNIVAEFEKKKLEI